MGIRIVRILIEVIDTVRVEQRGATFDTVNLVAFGEKKLGKIRSVLACNSCNQGSLQTMTLLVIPGWA